MCGEREATIVAPPPGCVSAVVPCFHGSLIFFCRHSLLWISSTPIPSVHLLTANRTSHSTSVLQSPRSSSQLLYTPVNTHPSLGHVGLQYGPSVYFSLCPICHSSATSLSSNSLKCFPLVPINSPIREGVSPLERGFPEFGNLSSASAPLPWGACPVLLLILLLLASFFHPTQLCRDLYSPFQCPRSSASF